MCTILWNKSQLFVKAQFFTIFSFLVFFFSFHLIYFHYKSFYLLACFVCTMLWNKLQLFVKVQFSTSVLSQTYSLVANRTDWNSFTVKKDCWRIQMETSYKILSDGKTSYCMTCWNFSFRVISVCMNKIWNDMKSKVPAERRGLSNWIMSFPLIYSIF